MVMDNNPNTHFVAGRSPIPGSAFAAIIMARISQIRAFNRMITRFMVTVTGRRIIWTPFQ
jgi:hypothetical protein